MAKTNKKPVKRLKGIIVNKVSLVDDPAILETFAIIKRKEGVPVSDEITPDVVEEAEVVKSDPPAETPEPIKKADSEIRKKEAFIACTAELRKVAPDMDEEDLSVLASLLSFTKYRYGYDYQPADMDPRLKRMTQAAKWTDEEWATVTKSLEEPEPAPEPELAPAEEPVVEEAPVEPAPPAEPVETEIQKAERILREKDELIEKQRNQQETDTLISVLARCEEVCQQVYGRVETAAASLSHATGQVED